MPKQHRFVAAAVVVLLVGCGRNEFILADAYDPPRDGEKDVGAWTPPAKPLMILAVIAALLLACSRSTLEG
jgi:hypothetical protein